MIKEIVKINFIDKSYNYLKHNLKVFIVLLAATFILLFSFFLYESLEEKNNIKIADRYTQASILIKQKKLYESKQLLESIINKDHHFYSPMALYLIIGNNIESDHSKIISHFDKILKNNSIDKENLNLIKIKKSIYLIGIDKEELIVTTLNPVVNSDSVWRIIAINLLAEYFSSKGQKFKADEYIKLLNNETRN
jgi:predicted negative regulator of RcsB-dependent stress response|tara:strand:+ start:254 stop:835 length:582 start_codon:yes stop_codon:yes gene_type:complete